MIKIIITLLIVAFFCGCLGQRQPQITDKEQVYFAEVTKSCHCRVERSFNTVTSYNNKQEIETGLYGVAFDYGQRNILSRKDSLRTAAFLTARKLHSDVLLNFNYHYDVITILYLCDKTTLVKSSLSFSFNVDTLSRIVPTNNH